MGKERKVYIEISLTLRKYIEKCTRKKCTLNDEGRHEEGYLGREQCQDTEKFLSGGYGGRDVQQEKEDGD